jgi:hypothetical protein
MKLYKQELLLLKKLARLTESSFTVTLHGDIKVENSIFYSTEAVNIFLDDKKIRFSKSSVPFIEHLKEKLGYTSEEITNFSWADFIHFNRSSISCNDVGKCYSTIDDRAEFYSFLLSEFSKYFDTTSLTVLYKDNKGIFKFNKFTNDDYIYIELFNSISNRIIEKMIIIKTTLQRKIRRERDFIILEVAPNYETPNVQGYLNQMRKLARESSFAFKIKEVDKDVEDK